MREIHFRGWHAEAKDMVYFGLGEDGIKCMSEDGEEYTFQIDDGHPVMQFTGLNDKNGVEIYDRDIVKWDDCSDGKYWRVAEVAIDPDIQFRCFACPAIKNHSAAGYTFHFGSFAYKDTGSHLTVIGNIYQNPELLEGASA